MKIYTSGSGHMIEVAATPIYGKNTLNIFSSRYSGPIAMKHVM